MMNFQKLTAVIGGLLVALTAGAAGKKISDYTETLTVGDAFIYEIAVPGVTNYKVTFGAMATNIIARVPVTTTQLNIASNAVFESVITLNTNKVDNYNGLVTNLTSRGLKLPAITAARPLFIDASGNITNVSGTPNGLQFVRDDGTLAVPSGSGGGVSTNALQATIPQIAPFDPAKTYVVFMGDSITASLGRPSYPYVLTNSFPAWSNLFFFTNQADFGVDWHSQTNTFFTSTLPSLPLMATNGTNVIISTMFGANEVMGSTFLYTNIQCLSNFVTWAKTRNYKIASVTPLPRGGWAESGIHSGGADSAWAAFSDYIIGDTNINFAVDAGSMFGDCFDPRFYDDTDPTNSPLHALHLGPAAHKILAREWDRAVRFGQRPNRPGMAPRRFGNSWLFFDTAYNVVNAFSTNGSLYTVRGNGGSFWPVGTQPAAFTGGSFLAGNASNPGLVAQAFSNTMSVPFVNFRSGIGASLFSVEEDGDVAGVGSWAITGDITARRGGGGPFFSLLNTSVPYEWRLSTDGGGIFYITDHTKSLIRVLIETNGNFGVGTTIAATNRLDVNGHTSLRSNLFLPTLPTNGSPIAFLATDAGGQVYETAVTGAGGGDVTTAQLNTASNVVWEAQAGKQTGSFLLTNLLAMGVSNVLAGPGIALATNNGVLYITNTGVGSTQMVTAAIGTLTVSNELSVGTLNANLLNLTNFLGSNQVRLGVQQLTNVALANLQAGQSMVWNSSADKWTNANLMAANVVSNIMVTATNDLLLDFSMANIFKIRLLTNFSYRFTNAAYLLNKGYVYFQQDAVGVRLLNTFMVEGGVLQTNANMQPTTNALALDVLEVMPGLLTTNLICWWPQNFQPRVDFPGSSVATFNDNFDRTSSDPMSTTASGGGTWTSGPGLMGDCLIEYNLLRGATATDNAARVLSPTFANNQSARIQLAEAAANFVSTGPMVRIQSTTDGSGYVAAIQSTTSIKIQRVTDNGATVSYADLGGAFTVTTLVVGDTVTLEISGTTLTLYVNGVSQGTRPDSTFATGQPGVWFFNTIGIAENFYATDL